MLLFRNLCRLTAISVHIMQIVIVERFEVGLWTKPSFRGLLSQLLATFLMHVKQVPRSKVQVRR